MLTFFITYQNTIYMESFLCQEVNILFKKRIILKKNKKDN